MTPGGRSYQSRSVSPSSAIQPAGVPVEMIGDECGHEVITVIVALVPPQVEMNLTLRAGGLQAFGLELLLAVRVVCTLVDENPVESIDVAGAARALARIKVEPGRIAPNTPDGPYTTLRTSSSLPTHTSTTSAPWAAREGVTACRPG